MKRCNYCFDVYVEGFTTCPHCGYIEGDIAKELYHLYPGTILNNRYNVGQVLGFGGFGITYLAWDNTLNTMLAIKEYYPSGLVNRVPGTKNVSVFTGNRLKEYNHGLMRFLDEARSMAKFSSHRDIINIFEYFEENGTAYIVMEYLDGLTLSEFLKSNKMDVEGSIQVVSRVCAALKDVHAAGIVHRDISPDNIFLCANGVIKLIDFGAARFSNIDDKLLTIILKPGFAPPEQYERVNVQGPWTDIYALGATMYYMVTGYKPEESTNRKIADTLLAPHQVDPTIPPYVGNTIMQAMAIDRHMRFSSIAAFEKALNQEKKVLPVATQIKRRKARRFVGLTATLLIIAAIGFVFFTFWRRGETIPPADISIAFFTTGDDANARENAFVYIISRFREGFPDVSISISTYPQDEYEAAILSAIARGNPYTMFESTGLGPNVLGSAMDLSGVIEELDIDAFHFLNEYQTHFPAGNQLPLGFVAPIIYLNPNLSDFTGAGIRNIEDLLLADTAAQWPLVVMAADVGAFYAMFGDVPALVSDTAIEMFYDERAAAIFSTTSIYSHIQSQMRGGRYRLIYMDTNAPVAQFTNVWSISQNIEENERIAAERFLRYLLSDVGQDVLHLRNRSNSLPISRYVFNLFYDVHSSDFTSFFDNIESYVFNNIDVDIDSFELLVTGSGQTADGEPLPSISLSRYDEVPGVTGEPFLIHEIAGQDVGLITIRAILYLIGSDPEYDLLRNEPAQGWVTIRGYNTAGDEVTLAATSGDTTIIVTINGEPHPMTDISAWAGPEVGIPIGQLPAYTLNRNLFLPLLTIANVFGYELEMINGTEIIFTPRVNQ